MIGELPKSGWCPIGSLSLHTYNYEETECIWCGDGRLAWMPGRWVQLVDSEGRDIGSAWTTWGPLTEKQRSQYDQARN